MSSVERVKNLQEKECIVDVLRKETAEHKCNDCGKCVYGYEGITQLQTIFGDVTQKKGRNTDMALVEDLCGLMKTQSLCEDGVDIAEAVLYAVDQYADDIQGHVSKKACKAGVCKKFMTYHILPDMCTGCGDCIDECEDDAIIGKKRFIHIIDQDECIQCGACLEACDDDAIVIAGADKPRTPRKPIPCKRK